MSIEKILEKVLGHTFWELNPSITLRVLCSCGKKYYIKQSFNFWNRTYETKEKCPHCQNIFSLKHRIYKDENDEKYDVEILN